MNPNSQSPASVVYPNARHPIPSAAMLMHPKLPEYAFHYIGQSSISCSDSNEYTAFLTPIWSCILSLYTNICKC
ncbi:hypothetical protein HK096_010806 [Nowakowskiella sp. JEL0078]|nr:hypothetical protein HK096_010806 [Nowakowskiella sp. JEL0078]